MSEQENMGQLPKKGRFSHIISGTAGIFIIEALKILVLAGITIFLVRYYLFKPFYVKGASMEPNFLTQEYLIIDELTYRFHPPVRGEVVVFKYPEDPKQYFLKRIIGLPGERVKITEGKVIVYNDEHPEGVTIDESYLPPEWPTMGEKNTTLKSDEYFVLGDNRPNSYDSRRFGPVKKDAIVGRVIFRGWPFNRMQTFKTPEFKELENLK